jgi:hypothetical protein
MQLNFLAFAVPLFIFFMFWEYMVARKRNISYRNLHDTLANICVGIAGRLSPTVWLLFSMISLVSLIYYYSSCL